MYPIPVATEAWKPFQEGIATSTSAVMTAATSTTTSTTLGELVP